PSNIGRMRDRDLPCPLWKASRHVSRDGETFANRRFYPWRGARTHHRRHMHAYPADMALAAMINPATGKPTEVKNGEAHLQACLAEMKRLSIVKAVVCGGDGD